MGACKTIPVRPDEKTRLGFSPNDALKSLRVTRRRLSFSGEQSMLAGASFFKEMGLGTGTAEDEATVGFVPSRAPANYCPGGSGEGALDTGDN